MANASFEVFPFNDLENEDFTNLNEAETDITRIINKKLPELIFNQSTNNENNFINIHQNIDPDVNFYENINFKCNYYSYEEVSSKFKIQTTFHSFILTLEACYLN